MQVIHVPQPQESALRITLFIHQREHKAGQIRMVIIQDRMRREMDNPIALQIRIHRGSLRGVETQSRHPPIFRDHREYGISFLTRSCEAREIDLDANRIAASKSLRQTGSW